ncbi:MAG: hypothetical protein ACKV1O_30955 [Saprospiraceae bacterium]
MTTYFLYKVTGKVKTTYGRRRNKVVACLVIANRTEIAVQMATAIFDLQYVALKVDEPLDLIKKVFVSHTLANGQVITGDPDFDAGLLSSKFQSYVRDNYGLDDIESLACFVANHSEYEEYYKGGKAEIDELSKPGFEKMKGVVFPHFK